MEGLRSAVTETTEGEAPRPDDVERLVNRAESVSERPLLRADASRSGRHFHRLAARVRRSPREIAVTDTGNGAHDFAGSARMGP